MPIYTYVCTKCDGQVEVVTTYERRDDAHTHEGPRLDREDHYILPESVCGGPLRRVDGLELPTVGKSSYQPGVILGSGQKLAGSFKTARKKKGWFRP